MRYLVFAMSYLLVATAAIYVGVYISKPEQAEPLRFIVHETASEPLLTPTTGHTSQTLSLVDIERAGTIFRQQFIAHQLAAAGDIPALKNHLDSVLASDDQFYYYNLSNIFLERFIELDVYAAIRYIETIRIEQRKIDALIASVVTSWVRHDPEAAIDYFHNISNQQLKNQIGARLLQDTTLQASGLLPEIEQALGTYGSQITASLRMQQQSPESLFEEALLLTGRERQQRLTIAMSQWMQSDPNAALQRLGEFSNPQERKNMLRMIIAYQGRQDPLAALRTAKNYAPDDMELEGQALAVLARQNPEVGMAYVEAFAKRTGNSQVLANVISNWASSDLDAALAYAGTIEKKHQHVVHQRLAYTYIQTDPEAGMQWVMSLADHDIRNSAVSMLAQINVSIAEDWLDKLDDQQLTNNLMQNIASVKAQNDPESAYQWLQGHRDSDGYQNALSNIVQQWATRDPDEAVKILEQHADDKQLQHVFGSLASTWANRDQDAAVAWMNSLPEGDNKNAATQSLVMQTWRNDPDHALDILGGLPEQQAQNLRIQIAYEWARKDPDALNDITRKLALSDEEESDLRRNTSSR